MAGGRTAEDVFQHHADRLAAADIDGILADYSDDAALITPSGTARGKDALRAAFRQLLGELPEAQWEIRNAIYEGDIAFVEWVAHSTTHQVTDGVDTFVIRDGKIVLQTARFTLVPVSAA